MSSVKTLVPVLLLSVGCAPQSAEVVSGSFVAFFSERVSASLGKEEVDPTDFDTNYTVDCRDAGYYLQEQVWNGSAAVPDEFAAAGQFACRSDERDFRLEDSIGCGPQAAAVPNGFSYCGEDGRDGTDYAQYPAENEVWINQAGFRVVTEELEPWRGEAVITAEGDLQIGFHHRLPGGADFRFTFTIDPDFQPTRCDVQDDLSVKAAPFDGDWIENWSEELPRILDRNERYRAAFEHMEPFLEDGRLFFLNGQSFQRNPRSPDDAWSLPDQYEAGTARGKISEELLIQRQSIWAFPFVYAAVDDPADDGEDAPPPPFETQDLWFCDYDPEDTSENPACQNYQPEIRSVFEADSRFEPDPGSRFPDLNTMEAFIEETADRTANELRRVLRPVNGEDPIYEYRPLTHMNRWRPRDVPPAGFDGWGEMHYNYVVFSGDSELEVGGAAEGAFTLALEAQDSWTQVFVKGRFVIDRIRQDRWVTEDLRESKAEENDVELCFQQ